MRLPSLRHDVRVMSLAWFCLRTVIVALCALRKFWLESGESELVAFFALAVLTYVVILLVLGRIRKFFKKRYSLS